MPDQIEAVVSVPLDRLRPFPNHPFKVRDDDAMKETVESMKQFGILVPAIVRSLDGGDYEIVAGHRRAHAAELAGISEMPAIVREMDDDTAVIFMVDSNLQREDILPSERAAAYKMKLEAIKRQGERRDLTCAQVGHKLDGKKSVHQRSWPSRSQSGSCGYGCIALSGTPRKLAPTRSRRSARLGLLMQERI